MITVSKKQVLQMMEQKEICYFKVADISGKNIAYVQDEEGVNCEDAVQELSEFLDNCEPGLITVILSERSFKDKGNGGNVKTGSYSFKVRIQGQQIAGASAGLSAEYKDLMHKNVELQMQLIKMEHQHKTDEIVRKLEEKIEQNKNADPIEKYQHLLQPLMAYLLPSGAQSPVQGISGHNDDEKLSDSKRITNAVNRILKIDKDFVKNLEALADFAEKSPEKYKSFVPMLKVM